MRVERGSFHETADRGWLHGEARGKRSEIGTPATAKRSEIATATPGARDAAYSFILGELTLSAAHTVQLLQRGLDKGAITRNLYATAASREQMSALATEAAKRVAVAGVPGFVWRYEGHWAIAANEDDLLIPVRDHRYRIIALRRRTKDPDRRYRWCSSESSPSGAPPHHSEPWNAEFRPALYVTEGELKADVVAALTGITTIGLPGADSIPAGFGASLRDAYPSVPSAFVAYDADFRNNTRVRLGRARVAQVLKLAGFRVRFVEWDECEGKGFDDVLSARVAA